MVEVESTPHSWLAVSDPFERDRLRLERILGDVAYLVGHQSFFQAAKRFGEFRRGLELHMSGEERVMLPAFIAREGDPAAAGRVREEHALLRRFLAQTSSTLTDWDDQAFSRVVTALQEALEEHFRHERTELYEPLQRSSTYVEWRTLVCRCLLD